MTWRAQIDDHGVITRYKDLESGQVISAQEFARQQQSGGAGSQYLSPTTGQSVTGGRQTASQYYGTTPAGSGQQLVPPPPVTTPYAVSSGTPAAAQPAATGGQFAGGQPAAQIADTGHNPLIQPGAQILGQLPAVQAPVAGASPTPVKGKNLRMEGLPHPYIAQPAGFRTHGFLDATSIAILIPTLIILTLIIAAAHKKRLFPWQTLRPFSPPSGLMTPREYERSYLCPPNARRSGRLGKRDTDATWTDEDGTVLPFGFLARTHLPVTIPLGRLPNKNMFIVAPSGSGKTTLMRAIIKAMLARPCVIVALEAKANDPNLDELKEGFKFTVLPAAQEAGFAPLYFNPLDEESVYWNPLDLDPITFASSLIPNLNLLDPEEQHWAERDHGYIAGLATLLKWGAVMVTGEDESGIATDVQPLPCNPRGLMRLVNNRRNIVESLRRLKNNPDVDPMELSELSLTLSSIIRTDTDWDKNIQGVRGRLRMFKNPNILRVTEHSSIDLRRCMFEPTVLIFGAPASLGPDAESLADCFVYQLQQSLHTRYGTASVLPLFAFFDEYQTLNLDIAGRLSAIVRGANGGLTVILQNISQISGTSIMKEGTLAGMAELKTIFSNSAVRICLHNADDTTARFFSDEIGKHAVVIPGVSDHFAAGGFGTFPTAWNRIHSQQVVSRVDTDAIKRMEAFHALLYLSPAGGSFGEVKPLMVDLRGIEEIARIHLLHSRHPAIMPAAPASGETAPGGAAMPGETTAHGDAATSGETAPGDAATTGERGTVPDVATAGGAQNAPNAPSVPAADSGRSIPLTGQALSRMIMGTAPQAAKSSDSTTGGAVDAGKTIIGAQDELGRAAVAFSGSEAKAAAGIDTSRAPTAAPKPAVPQSVQVPDAPTSVTQTPKTAAPTPTAAPQPAVPPPTVPTSAAPTSAVPTPVKPVTPPAVPPSATPSVASPPPPAQASPPKTAAPVSASYRICPHCGNIAGRGKFCISCGKSLAAQQPATSDSSSTTVPPQQNSTAENLQKPSLDHKDVTTPYPAAVPASTQKTDTSINGNTNAVDSIGTVSARRIPPPSMPSVYGIRNNNGALAPRPPQTLPTQNGTPNNQIPGAFGSSNSSNGMITPPVAFRTVNPSWAKRSP